MGATASEDDPFNGGGADAAGLAGARVDVVAELKKTGNAIRIHVIGDRRATQLDGFRKNFDQRGAKAGELRAGEVAGMACGTDAGVEESLVGVDVANAVEKRLVKERGLDRRLSIVKESDEVIEPDGERLRAGAFVFCVRRNEGEPAEASGVDET